LLPLVQPQSVEARALRTELSRRRRQSRSEDVVPVSDSFRWLRTRARRAARLGTDEAVSFTYEHPRPALTADAVVFRFARGQLEVLLIRRAHAPFEGQWALPGGFVDMDETVEHAAARELAEETGITGVELEQLHT